MRVLDLFCGAGGAAMGYHLAFPDAEIIGIDIAPQPNYPFDFWQGDALDALDNTGRYYDLIHASPPCQGYTTMSNRWRGNGGAADDWPKLIAEVRTRLQQIGVPYVIENVGGARTTMRHPICLTGGMFGLGVERPRLFETSFPVTVPAHRKVTNPIGVYGKHHDGRRLWTRKDGTHQRAAATLAEGRQAMGIDWMEWRELAESIPPAYTEHIGLELARTLLIAAA